MQSPLTFADRVVFISGANGAIPRATASVFASLGAKLVLTDVDDLALGEFANSLEVRDEAMVAKHDVSSEEQTVAVVAEAVRRFGRIDHLVTGAGIYPNGSLLSLTLHQWRRTLSINLDGAFLCSRECAASMPDGGSIVHIGSMAAHVGSFGHADYAASKGGVLSLARAMARDLAPRIRVNAVSPGYIESRLSRGNLAEAHARIVDQTVLKRIGQPEEVAKTIAFLCSDWASFINGEIVHVNGGFYMA